MEEAFERLSDMYSIEVQANHQRSLALQFCVAWSSGESALQLQREHFHGGQSDQV
jgi:hypothetical protein